MNVFTNMRPYAKRKEGRKERGREGRKEGGERRWSQKRGRKIHRRIKKDREDKKSVGKKIEK